MLSPEFVLCEVSISKMTPENPFAVSGVLAEITGANHCHIVLAARFPTRRKNGRPHLNPLPAARERRITAGTSSGGILSRCKR
jgi:hypothetical protein